MRVVRGEGPKKAKIMLIGESPGATEEKLGRPFVGLAGKFLWEQLAKIGIRREQVYVTNIVKVRVKGRPKKSLIEKWLPELRKEIERVKPEIIILLGKTAARYAPRISAHYFELPHPAAARRFPKQRKKFLTGLKKLQRLLHDRA